MVDFGSNTVDSDPSKVVVVMKNSGKVASSFRLNKKKISVRFVLCGFAYFPYDINLQVQIVFYSPHPPAHFIP